MLDDHPIKAFFNGSTGTWEDAPLNDDEMAQRAIDQAAAVVASEVNAKLQAQHAELVDKLNSGTATAVEVQGAIASLLGG